MFTNLLLIINIYQAIIQACQAIDTKHYNTVRILFTTVIRLTVYSYK